MRFLIAIGGKEFSEPTLRVGMKVASEFSASTTIAYVGEKISEFTFRIISILSQNQLRKDSKRTRSLILIAVEQSYICQGHFAKTWN